MTVEQFIETVSDIKIIYFATTEGDQPRVRPMNQLVDINGQLALCTSSTKSLFKQVASNPNVELCMFGAGMTVRVSGRCVPTTDPAVKGKYIELQPGVVKAYGGSDELLEVLVFETADAVIAKGPNKDAIKLY